MSKSWIGVATLLVKTTRDASKEALRSIANVSLGGLGKYVTSGKSLAKPRPFFGECRAFLSYARTEGTAETKGTDTNASAQKAIQEVTARLKSTSVNRGLAKTGQPVRTSSERMFASALEDSRGRIVTST